MDKIVMINNIVMYIDLVLVVGYILEGGNFIMVYKYY